MMAVMMTQVIVTMLLLLMTATSVTGYCAGLGANPGFRGPPKVEQVRGDLRDSNVIVKLLPGLTDQCPGQLARSGHSGGVCGPVHRQVLAGEEPQRLQDVRPPPDQPVQLRGGGPPAQSGLRLPGQKSFNKDGQFVQSFFLKR